MDKYSIKDLAYYRLEQARNCLQASESLIDTGHYKDSANRSYYSIFHSMKAILALDGYDSKKHSGIIAEFRLRYIKSGLIDVKFSDIIKDAFDIRTDSDYLDFYTIAKAEAVQQLENAKIFFDAIANYIDAYKF